MNRKRCMMEFSNSWSLRHCVENNIMLSVKKFTNNHVHVLGKGGQGQEERLGSTWWCLCSTLLCYISLFLACWNSSLYGHLMMIMSTLRTQRETMTYQRAKRPGEKIWFIAGSGKSGWNCFWKKKRVTKPFGTKASTDDISNIFRSASFQLLLKHATQM